MNEKKEIINKKHLDDEDKVRMEILNKQLQDECENREWENLVKTLGSLETADGHTNNTNIWKEMRKAFPQKNKTVPTGVKNIEGKLITNPIEKKKVVLDHFLHRMRKRPEVEDVKDVIKTNREVFNLRLMLAKLRKSYNFTTEELELVLKSLKTGKN